MVMQTVKNPSNLQIVWDDGVMLVFSFTAADGVATINCGIVHLAPHIQVGRAPPPTSAIQISMQESGQLYGDPQTWIETIKSAARGSIPNIQIDYEDQVGIFYNSWNLNSQSSFALQVLYSLAG
jgi:hypothetical protein